MATDLMYCLKTAGGGIIELDEPDLRRRIAEGLVRPWDHLSADGELFIQIRGFAEFREAFEGIAIAVSETCHGHADLLAEMRCGQCGRGFCGACLPETVSHTNALACPACGHVLESAFSKSRELPFWREPGRVLLYPLKDFSFITTIGVGGLTWLGWWLPPFSWVLLWIGLAWVSYVVSSSAEGKKEMGFGPDLDDIFVLMGRGLIVFLVTVAIAIPFLILNLFVVRQLWVSGLGMLPLLLLNLPLAAAAFCYYPMALGMAAVWNNKWLSFMPHVVISHILLIWDRYLVVLAAWAVLSVASFVAASVLRLFPLVGGLLASIVSTYFFMVQAHILGFTLYLSSSRLDWD